MNPSDRDPFATPARPVELPLAVRKQIVLARIVAERIEFAQAVADFRAHAHPARIAGDMLRGRASGLFSGLRERGADLLPLLWRLPRRYPLLGSLLGSTLSAMVRRRLRRAGDGRTARAFHPLRWALLAGVAYLAWKAVRSARD